MGRERSGSRGRGGSPGGRRRRRSGSGGGRENDFRGDLERNGRQQDWRDQGSAQRGAGSWPGRSKSAGRRRAEDDQGRRDQGRGRRDQEEDRSGWSEGRGQI